MKHAELVEELLRFGRETYAENGQVTPMVHVQGPEADVIATPTGPVEVADWMPGIVFGLAAAVGAYCAGFLAEAWMRDYRADGEPAPEHLRRGELAEREAAGDTNVRTCLLAGAVDRFGMTFQTYVLTVGDYGKLEWTPAFEQRPEAQMGGALPDGLRTAFAQAQRAPHLPPSDVPAAIGIVFAATASEGSIGLRA